MSTKPRIKLPSPIKVGDVIEVKTLISHVMETGYRKGADGNLVPRNIINSFTATFGGKQVVKIDLSSGVSANPYIAFKFKVPGARGRMVSSPPSRTSPASSTPALMRPALIAVNAGMFRKPSR